MNQQPQQLQPEVEEVAAVILWQCEHCDKQFPLDKKQAFDDHVRKCGRKNRHQMNRNQSAADHAREILRKMLD